MEDPRVEDAVRYHQAIYGEKPPTTLKESRREKSEESPSHPVESILEDAELAVAGYLEEKPVRADGGTTMEDVDHEPPYEGVQRSLERGYSTETKDSPCTDGGYTKAMPIGGAPSYVNTKRGEEESSIGEMPI